MGMSCALGRRMGERRGEGGDQPSVPNRDWVGLDGAAWSRVRERFKLAAGGRTRLHAKFGPCVVWQLPGGGYPGTASHWVSGESSTINDRNGQTCAGIGTETLPLCLRPRRSARCYAVA